LADGQGLILGIKVGPANRRDEYAAVPLFESLPVVVGPGGAPRVVTRLQGDAGYGWAWLVALVALILVTPVLALRGRKQHGSGLGRTRWVVERSLSWLNNYRRLRVCYERTEEHAQALHTLAVCDLLAKRVARLRPKVVK
jgi:transposase